MCCNFWNKLLRDPWISDQHTMFDPVCDSDTLLMTISYFFCFEKDTLEKMGIGFHKSLQLPHFLLFLYNFVFKNLEFLSGLIYLMTLCACY